MEFKEFFDIDENTSLTDWLENTSATRYSVQVNYRSSVDEVLEAFAKIALGYVSAALKQSGYHVKHVYEEKPIRILISTRNWDDGEWNAVVSFNPEHKCFIISKGFYNKGRKTVSLQSSKQCDGDSAADIAKELRNIMHTLKKTPDNYIEKLKAVPLKRGPRK